MTARSNSTRDSPAGRPARGQSNVIGVVLLLGVTVVALGTLTATIGGIVASNAAGANAERVAADLDEALRPVEATGAHRGRVSFGEGELSVVERELHVLNESGVVETVAVDALVYEQGQHRVTFLAGAVVHRAGDGAQLYAAPPITASHGSGGVLVVGAPVLGADDVTLATNQPTSVVLETHVTHDRTELADGNYSVAVETATPGPWRRHFERQGATVTTRDLDGDGTESVVADYPGERTAYLVVHDMNLTLRSTSGTLGGDEDA